MRDTLCGKTDFRRVGWLEKVTKTRLCNLLMQSRLRNWGDATAARYLNSSVLIPSRRILS